MIQDRPEPAAAADVRRAVDEILARPELSGEPEPSPLAEWLEGLFGGLDGAPTAGPLATWVAATIALAAFVWLGWTLARRRPRRAADRLESPRSRSRARRIRAREQLAEARRLRAAGELHGALRHYFIALVVGLGETGDLDYRDSWTNRELLERGRPSPDLQSFLSPWVEVLDRVGFGGLDPTEREVDELATACAARLGERP